MDLAVYSHFFPFLINYSFSKGFNVISSPQPTALNAFVDHFSS